MLEIYNTTDRVKKVPKFRYAGQYVLQPKSAVDIESFMAEFYKPWSRIGVVVRVKSSDIPNPKPVTSTTDGNPVTTSEVDKTSTPANPPQGVTVTSSGEDKSSKAEEPVKEPEPEVQEPVKETEPEVTETSEPEETAEATETASEEPEKVQYTQEYLSELTIPVLKDMCARLGAEPKDVRKRQSLIDAILEVTK